MTLTVTPARSDTVYLLLTPTMAPRTLGSMLHARAPRSIHRWLLTIMATLLVLGHVCELPAYAALVLPLNSTEDASADAHGHEAELSCDPVDAVSNTTSPVHAMGPAVAIIQVLPVASSAPGGPVTPSSVVSARLLSRPPLFVLYASLLI